MIQRLDFYIEDNQDVDTILDRVTYYGVGQSFKVNHPYYLDSAKLYLKKSGLPTGNVSIKIYSHTGTYGTSSLPLSLLATSAVFDVSTLNGNYTLKTFSFTGANRVKLTPGYYVLTLESVAGSDAGNYVLVGGDSSAPDHPGNTVLSDGSTWTADSAWDTPFYVYGETIDQPTVLVSGGGLVKVPKTKVKFPKEGWTSKKGSKWSYEVKKKKVL